MDIVHNFSQQPRSMLHPLVCALVHRPVDIDFNDSKWLVKMSSSLWHYLPAAAISLVTRLKPSNMSWLPIPKTLGRWGLALNESCSVHSSLLRHHPLRLTLPSTTKSICYGTSHLMKLRQSFPQLLTQWGTWTQIDCATLCLVHNACLGIWSCEVLQTGLWNQSRSWDTQRGSRQQNPPWSLFDWSRKPAFLPSLRNRVCEYDYQHQKVGSQN